jgi:nicotinamide riboside kinase
MALKKIAITGPECSGKTSLAIALHKQLGIPFVPEIAREYLGQGQLIQSPKDILLTTKLQLKAEKEAAALSSCILCDTDVLVSYIWCIERFGTVPPALEALYKHHYYDICFLCMPDMAWEYDPLRENPTDRDRLFEIYRKELIQKGISFTILSGSKTKRIRKALEIIKPYFN